MNRYINTVVKRYFISALLFLTAFEVHGQDRRVIDSLKSIIEVAKHDTSICAAYLSWGEQVYLSNPDTTVILFHKTLETAQRNLPPSASLNDEQDEPTHLEKRFLFFLAESMNNLGYMCNQKGDIPKALEYWHKSLKVFEKI